MLAPIGRLLIGAGVLMTIAGAAVLLLSRIGVNRLPGDIYVQRGRFSLYFPIVTCLILSLVLSLIMSLVSRWRR
jgi:hypothetical protein